MSDSMKKVGTRAWFTSIMKLPPRSRACITSHLKILLTHEEKDFKYHWTSCFTSRTNLTQTYLYSLLYNVVIRKCQMTPTKLNLLSYMIEKFVHYIYQLYVSVVILNIYTNFARLPERKQQNYSPVQAIFFLKPIIKLVIVMKNSNL